MEVRNEAVESGKKGGTGTMEWETILVLVLTLPIIFAPIVYICYLVGSTIYATIKESRNERVLYEKGAKSASVAK